MISPAVFNSSMKIWQSAGYHEVRQLEVMERSLGDDLCQPRSEVDEVDSPDWNRLTAIDNAAFRGFWRMSREGLKEALQSTSSSAVLVSRTNTRVTGYAIAGAQWGIGYLQRVAVDPDSGGQGLGTDLVRASLKWAAFAGARTMVLNVRPENERAKRVYNRAGLTYTGTNLHILRHGDFEAST